jgi:UDP-galactopyranose mutase
MPHPQTLLCFSHLRWGFVHQRPQHLLTRAAATHRVIFWEEPVTVDDGAPRLEAEQTPEGVTVMRPLLPPGVDHGLAQRALLDAMLAAEAIVDPLLWYYTPQALSFSAHLTGSVTVYDCMDELSAFHGADRSLPLRERALMRRADLVFTGGHSLYAAKRQHHKSVHAFPSGVDIAHFAPARDGLADPADQASLPRPRLGFYGVIDERFDRELLDAVAALRPDWQFVMVGPVVKIDPADLPRRPNIHYLGAKTYAALPAYAGNWDVALMPFARNEATRYISPTKTPEYLAAGLPVVSTPIVDVVHAYGGMPGVFIAETPAEFVAAAAQALELAAAPARWRRAADARLATMGWDGIWSRMLALIEEVADRRLAPATRPAGAPVLRQVRLLGSDIGVGALTAIPAGD